MRLSPARSRASVFVSFSEIKTAADFSPRSRFKFEEDEDSQQYYLQGNEEMESEEVKLIRSDLRHQPSILEALDLFWYTFEKDEDGRIHWESYHEVFGKLVKALRCGSLSCEEVTELAEAEWLEDTQGLAFLDHTLFLDAWFKIADVWTEGISELEYVDFILRLFCRLTTPKTADDLLFENNGHETNPRISSSNETTPEDSKYIGRKWKRTDQIACMKAASSSETLYPNVTPLSRKDTIDTSQCPIDEDVLTYASSRFSHLELNNTHNNKQANYLAPITTQTEARDKELEPDKTAQYTIQSEYTETQRKTAAHLQQTKSDEPCNTDEKATNQAVSRQKALKARQQAKMKAEQTLRESIENSNKTRQQKYKASIEKQATIQAQNLARREVERKKQQQARSLHSMQARAIAEQKKYEMAWQRKTNMMNDHQSVEKIRQAQSAKLLFQQQQVQRSQSKSRVRRQVKAHQRELIQQSQLNPNSGSREESEQQKQARNRQLEDAKRRARQKREELLLAKRRREEKELEEAQRLVQQNTSFLPDISDEEIAKHMKKGASVSTNGMVASILFSRAAQLKHEISEKKLQQSLVYEPPPTANMLSNPIKRDTIRDTKKTDTSSRIKIKLPSSSSIKTGNSISYI